MYYVCIFGNGADSACVLVGYTREVVFVLVIEKEESERNCRVRGVAHPMPGLWKRVCLCKETAYVFSANIILQTVHYLCQGSECLRIILNGLKVR